MSPPQVPPVHAGSAFSGAAMATAPTPATPADADPAGAPRAEVGEPPIATTTTLALPPNPHSPARARALVAAGLTGFAGETVDTAQVLVSELVTNAVLHAASPIVLAVTTADTLLRVTVEDASATPPQPTPSDPEAESGRGLWLVNALATSWGWHRTSAGKRVWFEL